jgi:exodeoxyribonuclease VII large subunit
VNAVAERPVFTVSELTARIKGRLEDAFPAVWVEGEISNLRSPSSGHAYFTLKDDLAQLRCVLFRGRGRRVRFALEDGLQVLVFGGLDVYAARGEYQLVAELMEPKGLGALQLAFEQLKKKLEAEGLFDQARKRPLPRFPRTIGIVTSPTGAALRDMLHIIGRRFGDLRVVIAPVRVQGEGAALEIVEALRDLGELEDLDVVIVGRGGGSIEDLWAFNDERVARAIAASRAPVVSAVGHETDVTIADFVADLRAPTPSAAAELVVREKLAVIRALVDAYDRLGQAMRSRVEQGRARVLSLARRRVLTDPARALRDQHRRVDELGIRLRTAARTHHRGVAHRVALLTNTLSSLHPLARISQGRAVLAQLRGRLVSAGGHSIKVSRHRFEASVGRLQSLSPLAVLGRGYSLTRLASGAVLRRAAETHPGAVIEILLHEGSLDARVERVRERDERHHV